MSTNPDETNLAAADFVAGVRGTLHMAEHVDVLIVGAGISGVSAAWHLQDRCPDKSYAILEARPDMGGTWNLFRYPGIRSDSDMYTLGFRFRPWSSAKAIVDGPSILAYVRETAAKWGIDTHIRHRHKIIGAYWSDAENRWRVRIDHDGEEQTMTASFLFMCSGYYNYDQGYAPDFPGQDEFTGQIVHPQHWPEDLDYAGKDVVVIGSGATALTLVPALADSGAGHVTMLQRSPAYIVSLPGEDMIAAKLIRCLTPHAAYTVTRWKNVLLQWVLYRTCQRLPQPMRRLLMAGVKRQLPEGFDVEKHFGPSYNPWDQRLRVVPNGDLFRSIREGRTDVVTDTIDRFTPTGIKLDSGAEVPADIVVTATGLNLQLFGGSVITIDGTPVDLTQSMAYKGMMLSGLPNLAYSFGYTNAAWTLKADLVSEFVCRLLNFMDSDGYDTVVPQHPGDAVEERPFMEFMPGYVLRSLDQLPKQGSVKPWRLNANYLADLRLIRHGKIADDGLRFFKHPAGSVSPAQRRQRTVSRLDDDRHDPWARARVRRHLRGSRLPGWFSRLHRQDRCHRLLHRRRLRAPHREQRIRCGRSQLRPAAASPRRSGGKRLPDRRKLRWPRPPRFEALPAGSTRHSTARR
jgi:monooxygenase